MKRLGTPGFFLVACSLALAACGDDSDEGGGTGGASTGGASTGGMSGAGTGGATGGAAGAGGAAGGTAGAGGGQAGSGGGTGGTASGGGGVGGTPSGGGGTPSGGTGGTGGGSSGGTGGSVSTTSVACGPLTCNLPQTFCCNFYNQPDQCMSPGATCGYGVDIACDGPEDCGGGQVCCGQLFIQGSNKSYQSFACAASCTGNDKRVICGQSGTCPGNGKCGASEILPEYKDCK